MPDRATVLAGFGALATLAGGLLLVVPSIASVGPVGALLGAIDSIGTHNVLLVAGLGLGGYLALALRSPSPVVTTEGDRFERAIDQPPESVDVPDEQLAGSTLDARIDAAIDRGGEEFETVRQRLRETATAVYATQAGASEEVARTTIDRGEWCDDPVAAQFLAGDPNYPLEAQLRLLALPGRERRRRIERTIAAIEQTEVPT